MLTVLLRVIAFSKALLKVSIVGDNALEALRVNVVLALQPFTSGAVLYTIPNEPAPFIFAVAALVVDDTILAIALLVLQIPPTGVAEKL